MNTWFTSDLHLGHENIIEYCKRPFKDGEHMDKTLIRNWNERVKDDDTVFHLGDFCFKGGWEGGGNKARYWENQLNGKVIHVSGNHDKNNSTKSILTQAIFEFGNKKIIARHVPFENTNEIPSEIDYALVGHVHEKWKQKWLYDEFNYRLNIPMINVGVDVWDFRPIKLIEIIKYYERVII
ncbi:MAG: hypothetical protein GY853_01645 [PVC group bacterium]|nr:hypothetical protein [PVC group bacterium]